MRIYRLAGAPHLAHVLFYRRIERPTGGHLKVWDYYQHVATSPDHTASVRFGRGTVWDTRNPWCAVRAEAEERRRRPPADVVFLAGHDWAQLGRWRRRHPRVPVVNLVQHVRHADPGDPRFRYLRYPAVRVCVSTPVADALAETGRVNGPLVTIPAGIDFTLLPAPPAPETRPHDLVVVATKQPVLGAALFARLAAGRSARLVDRQLDRPEFLRAIADARVALFLPNPTEGFYLPALEAMALGTVVVCPDVVGNRDHCRPGITSLGGAYDAGALAAATEQALSLPPSEAERLRAAAHTVAAAHDLASERKAFLALLDRLPTLWHEMRA